MEKEDSIGASWISLPISTIMLELKNADKEAIDKADDIMKLRDSIEELAKKENMTEQDKKKMQKNQMKLMSTLTEFDELTKKVQRLMNSEKREDSSSSVLNNVQNRQIFLKKERSTALHTSPPVNGIATGSVKQPRGSLSMGSKLPRNKFLPLRTENSRRVPPIGASPKTLPFRQGAQPAPPQISSRANSPFFYNNQLKNLTEVRGSFRENSPKEQIPKNLQKGLSLENQNRNRLKFYNRQPQKLFQSSSCNPDSVNGTTEKLKQPFSGPQPEDKLPRVIVCAVGSPSKAPQIIVCESTVKDENGTCVYHQCSGVIPT